MSYKDTQNFTGIHRATGYILPVFALLNLEYSEKYLISRC
jgi:hypothetical protein